MAGHAYMRLSHMTWLLMNLTGGFPKVYNSMKQSLPHHKNRLTHVSAH